MPPSERPLKDELYELLRHCTVQVHGARGARGTGFFVAPGRVVTSAHLLQGDTSSSFTVEWHGKRFGARVTVIHSEPIPGDHKRDWPDLAVLEVEADQHPCVLLGTDLSVRDTVYTFGFSDANFDGDPVTISFEGFSGAQRMLKLKEGQIRPGLSGAPILNERTGEVVGVLQLTRDREIDLGGYGTSVTTLLEYEPDLGEQNKSFHLQDDRWRRLLPKRSPLRTVAMTCALTVVLAAGISIVSIPASWHRLVSATAVILPFTSSGPARAQISEDLTRGLSEEWYRETGIDTVDPDLVRPLAATLSYRERPCVPMEVLDWIRKFTGAAYVVNGSFETYRDQQPKTLRLCLQSTWDYRQHSFIQQDLVPEARNNPLSEVARRLSHGIRVPLRAVLRLRQDRITEDPVAAQLYFEGLRHFQRYELQIALDRFDSASKRDPRFYPAYDGLSRVWQELGNDGNAQDEARKALTLFEESGKGEREWTLLQGALLVTEGKWSLAIDLYRALWHRDMSDVTAAVRLAEAQNLAGRSEDALKTIQEIRGYQEAKSLEMPIELDANLDLEESIAHHLAGEFAKQRIAAERAEKVGLDHDLLKARSWYLRCDALVSQDLWSNDCQQAADNFRIGGDPINYAKFLQLEARRLLRGHAAERALLIDREAAQIFTKNEFTKGIIEQMTNLAYSLVRQNPPQEAEAEILCDKAVTEARKSRSLNLPMVLINCAYFPTMTGDLRKAREMYESGLEMVRKRGRNPWIEAVALGNLAYVYHGLDHKQEALQFYEKSIDFSKRLGDSGPEFGETLIRYARLLSDLGRAKEAEDFYKQGLGELEGVTDEELREFLASMTKVLRQNPQAWKRLTDAHRFAGA